MTTTSTESGDGSTSIVDKLAAHDKSFAFLAQDSALSEDHPKLQALVQLIELSEGPIPEDTSKLASFIAQVEQPILTIHGSDAFIGLMAALVGAAGSGDGTPAENVRAHLDGLVTYSGLKILG